MDLLLQLFDFTCFGSHAWFLIQNKGKCCPFFWENFFLFFFENLGAQQGNFSQLVDVAILGSQQGTNDLSVCPEDFLVRFDLAIWVHDQGQNLTILQDIFAALRFSHSGLHAKGKFCPFCRRRFCSSSIVSTLGFKTGGNAVYFSGTTSCCGFHTKGEGCPFSSQNFCCLRAQTFKVKKQEKVLPETWSAFPVILDQNAPNFSAGNFLPLLVLQILGVPNTGIFLLEFSTTLDRISPNCG